MSIIDQSKPPIALHRQLVEAAIQAPSPDNNQPWRFVSEGDDLLVYLVAERSLPSDVHAMCDLTSLGAAIENACLAARQLGLDPSVDYLAPPVIRTSHDASRPIARIRLTPGADADP